MNLRREATKTIWKTVVFAGAMLGYLDAEGELTAGAFRRAVVHGSAVASLCVEHYGTEGVLFTDVTRETSLRVFSKAGAGYTVEKSQGDTGWLFPPIDEAWVYGYREEMRHFIECVAQGRMPRETFEDGFIVNCILDSAYLSANSKRWEKVDYSQ